VSFAKVLAKIALVAVGPVAFAAWPKKAQPPPSGVEAMAGAEKDANLDDKQQKTARLRRTAGVTKAIAGALKPGRALTDAALAAYLLESPSVAGYEAATAALRDDAAAHTAAITSVNPDPVAMSRALDRFAYPQRGAARRAMIVVFKLEPLAHDGALSCASMDCGEATAVVHDGACACKPR
jgi:aminopeptidase N